MVYVHEIIFIPIEIHALQNRAISQSIPNVSFPWFLSSAAHSPDFDVSQEDFSILA